MLPTMIRTHAESNLSRKLRDSSNEKNLIALLRQVNVFSANKQAKIPEKVAEHGHQRRGNDTDRRVPT